MIHIGIMIIALLLCTHSFSFGIYTIRKKKNYFGGGFMLAFNIFALVVLTIALYRYV